MNCVSVFWKLLCLKMIVFMLCCVIRLIWSWLLRCGCLRCFVIMMCCWKYWLMSGLYVGWMYCLIWLWRKVSWLIGLISCCLIFILGSLIGRLVVNLMWLCMYWIFRCLKGVGVVWRCLCCVWIFVRMFVLRCLMYWRRCCSVILRIFWSWFRVVCIVLCILRNMICWVVSWLV